MLGTQRPLIAMLRMLLHFGRKVILKKISLSSFVPARGIFLGDELHEPGVGHDILWYRNW
ncbi:hypothetical protein BRADI_1g04287v3 [Brachypodium distachyon]|uniref:Uncharacterized protein n=1 Tax=Brachypodium distachyon TaxID=15368 RepID=A0A2K2DI12_BRADI|nr:hypothetical protein BRADI_1g04287v3 [Brachypodium distachyon]